MAYPSRKQLIERRKFLQSTIGIFVIGWTKGSTSAYAKIQNLNEIKMHTSDESGLFANSYILSGKESLTLFDAQLGQGEAEQLIELIRQFDKPLETIVISHSHPDHYLGLEWIGPAFPNARIMSAEASIEIMMQTFSFWENFSNPVDVIGNTKISLSGHEMECMVLPDAESVSPLVLYMHQQKALFSGDHTLQGQHLWLAEGRADQWVKNLTQLQNKFHIETIMPGHGQISTASLLQDTAQYIQDFLEIVKSCRPNDNDAMKEMINYYPDHRFPQALTASLQAYC